MKRSTYVIISFALFFLSACFSYNTTKPPATKTTIDSFEILFSRSSVTKAEFEHYKLSQGQLFYECGEIKRDRYVPDENEILTPAPELAKQINDKVIEIASFYQNKKPSLDEPGTSADFTDPGLFTFNSEGSTGKVSFKTSFDSISTKNGALETRLHHIVRLIRSSLPNPPCLNKRFYGIHPLAPEKP